MTPIETYIFATLFIFALFFILFLLRVFINLDKKVDKLEKEILKIKQPPFTLADQLGDRPLQFVANILAKRKQEEENKK